MSNDVEETIINEVVTDVPPLIANRYRKDYIDAILDKDNIESEDLFSFHDIVRGQPPKKRPKVKDLKPIVFIRFNTRLGKAKPITLKALLDSGASATLVASKHTKNLRQKKSDKKTVWTTPAGELETTYKTRAQFTIPELHDNRLIEWNVHVAKNLGAYDMIIGRDIMKDLEIDLLFSSQTITWDSAQIPFKNADATEQEAYHIDDPQAVSDAADRVKQILDAKYEKANLREVADNATHLTLDEREKLYALLTKYEELFDGTLGTWSDVKHDIEVRKGAEPYHAKAYPIPQAYVNTLKVEVERLCEVGVLKRVNRSEWAAPTFVIPKKDGSVRFISDFRELNKRIHRKPYPIPKIQDLLQKLEGFQHATSLDLNMGYYHIELTPNSKRLCTIVLPFGKFEYQRLPMGLCNSPDIFQEKMSDLMRGLEFVRAYIDDLLVLTKGNFDEHLDNLELVLQRLQVAGLKVNAVKSFFARGELEYLGYWITRQGVQPVSKKVNAILNIAEPKNRKELRSFIGLVNYYRDMWIRRSHILAPLARLTSKDAKFKWGPEEAKCFKEMKHIISKQTLLAYPDFNEKFVIHTDASHLQLGGVISQKGKPIAFYSRKLNPAQTRYTTTERELLSIVETLKEFRNILLGQRLEVHTDHKNLTCRNFNTERVMRWRLVLEEYGPEILYVKGEDNVVADALSRLPLENTLEQDDPTPHEDIERMAEIFANDEAAPHEEIKGYPLPYKRIYEAQQTDEELQKRFLRLSTHDKKEFFHSDTSYELITYEDRIVLPKSLTQEAVDWYHTILLHPGETRTELSMAQHYYWSGMRQQISTTCKRCPTCQIQKKMSLKYGILPPKTAEVKPWHTLCIDLIGKYPILETKGTKSKKKETLIELQCLTMVDPATGWFDIVDVTGKTAIEVGEKLQQAWLTQYPWPTEIIMDRGKEFLGDFEQMLLNDYGIRRKAITTRNPQANAIVERCHQTIGNMLRVQEMHNRDPDATLDYKEIIQGVLAAVRFAMRATVHTTTRATPMQLVFGRDAILNTRFQADWNYIKDRKQRLIVQNNKRENATRREHTYKVDDRVKIRQSPNRKYGEDSYKGVYRIVQVNENGTCKLRRITENGGAVTQTWNIRNIVPYHD